MYSPEQIGITTGIKNTSGTSMTVASGSWFSKPYLAKDKVLVFIVFDPAGSTTPTVTISATNWTFSELGSIVNSPTNISANVGTKTQGWIGTANNNVTSSTSLTISAIFSNSISHAATSVYGFRNLRTTQRNARTSGIGVGSSGSVTTPSGIATDLIVAMWGQENALAALTYSTDTTNGVWQGKQGRSSSGTTANSTISVMSQYKILTGAGTQTASFGNAIGRNYAIQAFVIPAATFTGWGIPL